MTTVLFILGGLNIRVNENQIVQDFTTPLRGDLKVTPNYLLVGRKEVLIILLFVVRHGS